MMKALFHIFAFLLSLVSLADEVTLISEDNKEVLVDAEVAKQSVTILNMIEDFGRGHQNIPVHHVNGRTLQRVVDFMKEELSKKKPTDSQVVLSKRVYGHWGRLSPQDTLDLLKAVNYLDVRSNRRDDVLRSVSKIYGDRILHPKVLDAVSKKNNQEYAAYYVRFLDVTQDITQFIIEESLASIDRIFVNNSRDRRLAAIKQTSLGVAQVVAYIAAHNTPSMKHLPKIFQETLKAAGFGERGAKSWFGFYKNINKNLLFGPMPLEWAVWPAHCSLPSDPNYDMYSDANPDDRYVDNGDGTISDICTRLRWEQSPSPEIFERAHEAKNHCEKLNKAGFNDWSVPTAIESQTLVDYTKRDPAMNAIFHDGSQVYWQFPQVATIERYLWLRDFSNGENARSKTPHVRCVRRPGLRTEINVTVEPMEHYTIIDKTVFDDFTGKQWEREITSGAKDHNEAIAHCAELRLDYKNDWRVPLIKELGTIVDAIGRKLATDKKAFPRHPGMLSGIWSNTAVVGKKEEAWLIDNSTGRDEPESAAKGIVALARCVR